MDLLIYLSGCLLAAGIVVFIAWHDGDNHQRTMKEQLKRQPIFNITFTLMSWVTVCIFIATALFMAMIEED